MLWWASQEGSTGPEQGLLPVSLPLVRELGLLCDAWMYFSVSFCNGPPTHRVIERGMGYEIGYMTEIVKKKK